MTPGPKNFRGPMGFREPLASGGPEEAHGLERGPIELKLKNQHVKLFFLEITSYFGTNCGIFFVCFGLHNTGNPSYLSWPRAHVRPPAALVRVKVRVQFNSNSQAIDRFNLCQYFRIKFEKI